MTGIPENNASAFNDAAKRLRALGYECINPIELDETDPIPVISKYDKGYFDNLRRDIALLTECDSILLLKGWELSYGARAEYMVADSLQMRIVRLTAEDELKEVIISCDTTLSHVLPSAYWD